MNNDKPISNAVIRRLPRYRRLLGQLRIKGVTKISSNELSELIGYTASQIRQDFNTFGEFGQQGYGYSVEYLYDKINEILGLGKGTDYKTVVVGVGNIGQAITNYTYYYKIGFKIIGLFDTNPKVVGNVINDVEVLDCSKLEEFCKDHNVDIGVICVNRENAQEIADRLCTAGVRGIWNFAPIDLKVSDDVALESVHLSDSLHTLSFMIKNMEDEKKK
jgi:redox-sensing transcriptional repressor